MASLGTGFSCSVPWLCIAGLPTCAQSRDCKRSRPPIVVNMEHEGVHAARPPRHAQRSSLASRAMRRPQAGSITYASVSQIVYHDLVLRKRQFCQKRMRRRAQASLSRLRVELLLSCCPERFASWQHWCSVKLTTPRKNVVVESGLITTSYL